MKNNSSSKKTSYITRGAMILLTTILIILFFCIMLLVSQIQGTARIVNYAGLVRGKTQRIIKLEDAGQPHDEMIDSVSSYIKGLRYGSDELNLVRLEDRAFQSKMQELNSYFKELCEENINNPYRKYRRVMLDYYFNDEVIKNYASSLFYGNDMS